MAVLVKSWHERVYLLLMSKQCSLGTKTLRQPMEDPIFRKMNIILILWKFYNINWREASSAAAPAFLSKSQELVYSNLMICHVWKKNFLYLQCVHKTTFLHSCCFLGLYGLPKRNGKLKDISHFDAAFFGVHPKQANTMDPQLRLLLEIAYEAIVDGGEETGWKVLQICGGQ